MMVGLKIMGYRARSRIERAILSYLVKHSTGSIYSITKGLGRDSEGLKYYYHPVNKAIHRLKKKGLININEDVKNHRTRLLCELTEPGFAHAIISNGSLRFRDIIDSHLHFEGWKIISVFVKCIEEAYGEKFCSSFIKTVFKVYISIFGEDLNDTEIWSVIGGTVQGWIFRKRSRMNPRRRRKLDRCLNKFQEDLDKFIVKHQPTFIELEENFT